MTNLDKTVEDVIHNLEALDFNSPEARAVVRQALTTHTKELNTAWLEDMEKWRKRHFEECTEEVLKEPLRLLEIAHCPDQDCDNKGTIAVRTSDDEWEPQQCQWCYEKNALLNAHLSDKNN